MSRYLDADHCSVCTNCNAISVGDRLPSAIETVLFWVERRKRPGQLTDCSSWEIGHYDPSQDDYPWTTYELQGEIGRYTSPGYETVTHWRELPPRPERGE